MTLEERDAILSLHLINETVSNADMITTLYAVSNHTENHYYKYMIPKRNGGKRVILEPDYLLKHIQKNIYHAILESREISNYATAYHKHADVKKNAMVHVGAPLILKLDITSFFDSITFSMIYRTVFNTHYFPVQIGTLLTNLCCYNDILPQGAPTSAAISNLVMKWFDDMIGLWCEKQNIHYTRYCDDMTFSGTFQPKKIIEKVKGLLYSMGMELNEKKTKIINAGQRQSVTGIVVNQKLRVQSEYRKLIRQEIYYIEKFGLISHLMRKYELIHQPTRAFQERYLRSLYGKINYVLYIDPFDKDCQKAKNQVYKWLLAHKT